MQKERSSASVSMGRASQRESIGKEAVTMPGGHERGMFGYFSACILASLCSEIITEWFFICLFCCSHRVALPIALDFL